MGIIPIHVIPNHVRRNWFYTKSCYTKSLYTKSLYTKSCYTKQGSAPKKNNWKKWRAEEEERRKGLLTQKITFHSFSKPSSKTNKKYVPGHEKSDLSWVVQVLKIFILLMKTS
jgi:hypothetical protein